MLGQSSARRIPDGPQSHTGLWGFRDSTGALGHEAGGTNTKRSGGPDMATKAHPVLFIHGLWLHPQSWAAWEELFGRAGYETSAPAWPDEPETVEAARSHPEALADKGIEVIVDHYRTVIAGFATDPIIVGHSFGG